MRRRLRVLRPHALTIEGDRGAVKAPITVREYGRLTVRDNVVNTLALAHIDPVDFDWLCQLSQRLWVSHAPALAQVEDSQTL